MPGPGSGPVPVPPSAEKSPVGPARRRYRKGQLTQNQAPLAGETGSSHDTKLEFGVSPAVSSGKNPEKSEADPIPFLKEALMKSETPNDPGATPDIQIESAVRSISDAQSSHVICHDSGTEYMPGTIHRCVTPLTLKRRKEISEGDECNDMCRTGSPETTLVNPKVAKNTITRSKIPDLPVGVTNLNEFVSTLPLNVPHGARGLPGRVNSPADSEPALPSRRSRAHTVPASHQSDHSNVDDTSPSISPIRLLRGRIPLNRASWQPPKCCDGEVLITDSMSSPSPVQEARPTFHSRSCEDMTPRASSRKSGSTTPSCMPASNVASPSRVRNSPKQEVMMSMSSDSSKCQDATETAATNRLPQTLGPLKVTKAEIDEVPVVVNVGGIRFSTSRKTLSKLPEHLKGLIPSAAHREAFFDRDPTHFRLILNYLRDSSCALPLRNPQALQEIRAEARFFGIADLEEQADKASKEAEQDDPMQSKLLVSAVKEGFDQLRGSLSSLGSLNNSIDWETGTPRATPKRSKHQRNLDNWSPG